MSQITALCETVAKKQPVDSSALSQNQKTAIHKGRILPCESIESAPNNHVKAVLSYGAGTWYFYVPHVEVSGLAAIRASQLISAQQLHRIMPYASKYNIDRYHPPLNAAMAEFRINTPPRMAAFLAQLAHESGSLRYSEELASGAAYEGRKDLGNIHRGDGRRYKGRGPIQLTGRMNYRTVGLALGLPLEANPAMAAMPEVGARTAAYFWHSRNLNHYADLRTVEGFRAITRRINGGYNGWSDRLNYWNRAKQVLGV